MTKNQELAQRIAALSIKDAQEVANLLKDLYEVDFTLNVSNGSPIARSLDDPYRVVLKSAGQNKLQVVKQLRDMFGVSLIEGKQFVEGAPCILARGLDREAAERMKLELESVGAQIELR